MFCKKCGGNAPNDANFCPSCGTRLGGSGGFNLDVSISETSGQLVRCARCRGSGDVGTFNAPGGVCPACKGTGKVRVPLGPGQDLVRCAKCGGSGDVGSFNAPCGVCPVCNGAGQVGV
jgi:DnaJ-class molecular chaperone